jgi:Putative addiction module component
MKIIAADSWRPVTHREQRAALAAALIESLDENVDEDAEAAWSVEIARRLQQIQRGEVTTIPWPQARRMIVANERPDF